MQQKKTTPDGFDYFGFISYSHKNMKQARWFQKKFVAYHLPAKIWKNADVPERVTPIFRDETHLMGAKVNQTLEAELSKSRFVVALCSPDSVASQYVGAEAEYIIKTRGNADDLIAVVVDGIGKDDPVLAEHINPPLRPYFEKLKPINAVQQREDAFVRVVARMLGLNEESLVSYERQRRTRNKRIKAALISIASLFLILSAFFLYRYLTPETAYYTDIVERYGISEGLGKLEGSDASNLTNHYRMVSGNYDQASKSFIRWIDLTWPEDSSQAGAYKRYYITDEIIDRAEIYDINGRRLLILDYLPGVNDVLVLKNGRNPAQAYRKAFNVEQTFSPDGNLFSREVFSEQHVLYDANGRMQTDGNSSAAEKIYGLEFLAAPSENRGILEYDADGFVFKEYFTDTNGEAMQREYGCVAYEFDYDENGNLIDKYYLHEDDQDPGSNVVYRYKVKYDGEQNPLSVEFFNYAGAPVNNEYGIAKISYRWNEQGDEICREYGDKDGHVMFSLKREE